MIKLFIHWVLSAFVFMIISRLVPGLQLHGLEPALIAALVIGLLSGTLGMLLKIVTFPITILTRTPHRLGPHSRSLDVEFDLI